MQLHLQQTPQKKLKKLWQYFTIFSNCGFKCKGFDWSCWWAFLSHRRPPAMTMAAPVVVVASAAASVVPASDMSEDHWRIEWSFGKIAKLCFICCTIRSAFDVPFARSACFSFEKAKKQNQNPTENNILMKWKLLIKYVATVTSLTSPFKTRTSIVSWVQVPCNSNHSSNLHELHGLKAYMWVGLTPGSLLLLLSKHG
jgi:hypothetical protein